MRVPLPDLLTNGYGLPESQAREQLIAESPIAGLEAPIEELALDLARQARQQAVEQPGLDALLGEYRLSSREGVVLMCLAEALLRIPDPGGRRRLLHDLLEEPDWEAHRGHSHSHWVNAVTWGLVLTGRMLRWSHQEPAAVLTSLVRRLGDTAILSAIEQVTRELACQFVAGEDMPDALRRAVAERDAGYCHSFDMLGEAARTRSQADAYFQRYQHAIDMLPGADAAAGISVKLSALTPRFDWVSRNQVVPEIADRLRLLMQQAAEKKIPLTVDAEEARRLEMTLEIFALALSNCQATGSTHGIAVQAYQPRCGTVVDWLIALQKSLQRPIAIRLVKGAYWDTEIKFSQMQGHPAYPVYTRKSLTDLSYFAAAAKLLQAGAGVYPQFASHNAHTIAGILCLAKRAGHSNFEFQRLHGMGRALHDRVQKKHGGHGCRIYAPVGDHRELLPYLVRRLLENGANSSFVHAIANPDIALHHLIESPLTRAQQESDPTIRAPAQLYGTQRRNAPGLFYECSATESALMGDLQRYRHHTWHAAPCVDGNQVLTSAAIPCAGPADTRHRLGSYHAADTSTCQRALECACQAQPDWSRQPVTLRAGVLRQIGALYWKHRAELVSLLVYEAGKTPADALGELREAIDFCEYYALQAEHCMGTPQPLTGPTGENNRLHVTGRGVFACISPWNFPLAIFTGQVTAALVCGNAVLAKPASACPLIAGRATELMHVAGIPGQVLHLLPGAATVFSDAVLRDVRLGGVAFTGSTQGAWEINRTIASRDAPIIPMIAETGGQNALIVDSSALPEQVVDDVLRSAFNAAGQRCSALRFLYVQEEIADGLLSQLAAAVTELRVGHPAHFSTDCGPLISAAARQEITRHLHWLAEHATRLAAAPLPATEPGHYLAPQIWQLDDISQLSQEVFGPVLHVARFSFEDLDRVVGAINDTGFGLTLGIASRLKSTWNRILDQTHTGNVYINRDMIGATVGVQPFGGNLLSGTGPKAGGPNYLSRFLRETTVSINTAALGGNAGLLSGSTDSNLF